MKKKEPLIVRFEGFGGYLDTPCYKDQYGRFYFDLGDCHGNLELYTGAYLDEACGEICGEPCNLVESPIICEKPYKEQKGEILYMMLNRMKSDCDYFLGNGNGYEGHLFGGSVEKICDDMEDLWNTLNECTKPPKWLSLTDIKEYRRKMLLKRAERQA